jgi:protein-disulfide isomerase
MCAGLQGKFWEVHDSLFSSQARWAESASPGAVFDSLAVGSGVKLEPFHRCIAGKQLQALIEADRERATESGVSSTPTIMIGRTVIRGAEPTDVFRRTIDSALASGGR